MTMVSAPSGKSFAEEVARVCPDAGGERWEGSQIILGLHADPRQIEKLDVEVGVLRGKRGGEPAAAAAHVQETTAVAEVAVLS